MGTTGRMIICQNGDYQANGFTVVGTRYIDSNSFTVYHTGGSGGSNARFNYLIMVEV